MHSLGLQSRRRIGTIDAVNGEEVARSFDAVGDEVVIAAVAPRHRNAALVRRDDVQLDLIVIRSPHAELACRSLWGTDQVSAEGKVHSSGWTAGVSASSSSASDNRNTAPSGGSVSADDHFRPCSGTGIASMPPMFPCPLPP